MSKVVPISSRVNFAGRCRATTHGTTGHFIAVSTGDRSNSLAFIYKSGATHIIASGTRSCGLLAHSVVMGGGSPRGTARVLTSSETIVRLVSGTLGCRGGWGEVVVGGVECVVFLIILFDIKVACTRSNIVIANGICTSSRPSNFVNTAIVRRSGGKHVCSSALASFGNGFTLGIGGPTGILGFSCIKCGGGDLPVNAHHGFSIGLSVRGVLGRIAIGTGGVVDNDNNLSVPRERCSNTVRGFSAGTLRNVSIPSVSSTLRKHVTNLSVITGSNSLNDNAIVHVHNIDSVGKGARPLVLVGNIPFRDGLRNFSFTSTSRRGFTRLLYVDPSSVTRVTMLGSNTTYTV